MEWDGKGGNGKKWVHLLCGYWTFACEVVQCVPEITQLPLRSERRIDNMVEVSLGEEGLEAAEVSLLYLRECCC